MTLDSCKFWGRSKWKDEIKDEDGQYRNPKKWPVKVLRWVSIDTTVAMVVYVTAYNFSYEVAR